MKKKILLPLLILPIAGGWYWWNAAHATKVDPATEMKLAAVDQGPVKLVVMASGRISANYEVDIKCKASGEVVKLPFDVSDFVKKGELVLELNPVDENRHVKQVQADLTTAKNRVRSAELVLEVAEATLVTDTAHAQSALRSAEVNAHELRAKADRTRQLFESKLESQEQVEAAESAAARAELAVDDARNVIKALEARPININMLRNDVAQANIQVERAKNDLDDANQRLADTSVVAPIDGVVTTRPAQIGSIVSSGITNVGGGTSIMTISDLSRLFVLVPVNEADIGKVRRDQRVEISCDAFPEKQFEGKILRIAAKGVNLQNVVSFEVKIEILGEGKELLQPEMSTDIKIIVANKEKVLRVPSAAVRMREKNRQRYVLTAVDAAATQSASTATQPASAATQTASAATTTPAGAATQAATAGTVQTAERDITIGVDDGNFCEILSGLKEGEKVVVDSGGQGAWTKTETR